MLRGCRGLRTAGPALVHAADAAAADREANSYGAALPICEAIPFDRRIDSSTSAGLGLAASTVAAIEPAAGGAEARGTLVWTAGAAAAPAFSRAG